MVKDEDSGQKWKEVVTAAFGIHLFLKAKLVYETAMLWFQLSAFEQSNNLLRKVE